MHLTDEMRAGPNVLMSALLSKRGSPAEIVRLWVNGRFELIVSLGLLAELERVMAYPKIRSKVSAAEAASFLDLLTAGATNLNDPPISQALRTSDPGDDYLMALAQAAKSLLVSGDKHLLDMADDLPVYSPRACLKEIEALE